MSEPRITISIDEGGELNIYVNEAGRDVLVKELLGLSHRSDHSHLGTWLGAEVEMRDIPYRPTDRIVDAAKISLRPDEWDEQHFPHVLAGKDGV